MGTTTASRGDELRISSLGAQSVMYAVEPGIHLAEKQALNANWNASEIRDMAAQFERERGPDADREE
jgi:hypothetical protein